jgi:phage-related protein
MAPGNKPLVWLRGEIKTPPFSAAARVEAGILLRRLQQGETLWMPHSRPIPTISARCHELRIRDENRTWRIIYRVDSDAVLIGEVFAKTTRTTPAAVIANCKRRFRAYDEAREDEDG